MANESEKMYMVQLMFAEAPQLDENLLFSGLQKHCGNVERVSTDGGIYLYAFPEHMAVDQDGKPAPAQIFVLYPDQSDGKLYFERSLQQSWRWKGARQAVDTCTATLLLADQMTKGLDYKTRINLFYNALQAALSLFPCTGIHWLACQHFVDPGEYLEARTSGNFHPIQFAINVRFFNLSSQPGETMVDTLGLSKFGLPDLQCRFVDLELGAVGQLLYNLAYYIFDRGDIIQDGETIRGLKPDQRWTCTHAVSFLPPEREVLDINTGLTSEAGT